MTLQELIKKYKYIGTRNNQPNSADETVLVRANEVVDDLNQLELPNQNDKIKELIKELDNTTFLEFSLKPTNFQKFSIWKDELLSKLHYILIPQPQKSAREMFEELGFYPDDEFKNGFITKEKDHHGRIFGIDFYEKDFQFYINNKPASAPYYLIPLIIQKIKELEND